MSGQRLYLDTSTVGGYYDREWMRETRLLWEQARAGQWLLVTSIVAEAKIAYAPEQVRRLFEETFGAGSILDSSPQVESLAEAYLDADIVPARYGDDALHVAMATVHGVRFIVSWNFKHLVSDRREDGFNEVNRLQGWPAIRIVSPREIIYGNMPSPD